MSVDTHIRIMRSVAALGQETVGDLRRLGLPLRDIRMLADSTPEIRGIVAQQVKAGATREAVDALLSRLLEEIRSGDEARKSAREAKRREQAAEARAAKEREKRLAQGEEIKGLQSELRQARDRRTDTEVEAERTLDVARRAFAQVIALLNDVDWQRHPRVMALLDAEIQRVYAQLKVIRLNYCEPFDTLDGAQPGT